MRNAFGVLGLITVALLGGGTARANTIIMATGVDFGRGEGLWLQEDGQNIDAFFAGVIFISLTAEGHQYNRESLCVDLFSDINIGVQYDSTVLNPNQVPGNHLERVGWLIDNALVPPESPTPQSLLPQADWVVTPAQGAALQLAIWDIVHDNGDGFSAGRVQQSGDTNNPTDPTVLAWAQTYEAVSAGQSATDVFIYQNVDMSSGQQAQMLAGPQYLDGGPQPTPETATLFLAGTALVVIGLLRRDRIRTTQEGREMGRAESNE